MVTKIYCGIDPGKTGAIAFIREDRSIFDVYGERWVFDMPVEYYSPKRTRISVSGVENILFDMYGLRTLCAIEKQAAMPGQGVTSVFSLGDSFGLLRALAGVAYDEVVEVAPRTWQKKINRPSTGDSKADSLAMARELFPDYDGLSRKKDHNRADALLLAVYARIMFRNGGGAG